MPKNANPRKSRFSAKKITKIKFFGWKLPKNQVFWSKNDQKSFLDGHFRLKNRRDPDFCPKNSRKNTKNAEKLRKNQKITKKRRKIQKKPGKGTEKSLKTLKKALKKELKKALNLKLLLKIGLKNALKKRRFFKDIF